MVIENNLIIHEANRTLPLNRPFPMTPAEITLPNAVLHPAPTISETLPGRVTAFNDLVDRYQGNLREILQNPQALQTNQAIHSRTKVIASISTLGLVICVSAIGVGIAMTVLGFGIASSVLPLCLGAALTMLPIAGLTVSYRNYNRIKNNPPPTMNQLRQNQQEIVNEFNEFIKSEKVTEWIREMRDLIEQEKNAANLQGQNANLPVNQDRWNAAIRLEVLVNRIEAYQNERLHPVNC